MIATLLAALWLVGAHAVAAGLYWLLLLVPESNVLMLATSLVLALALAWWIGAAQAVVLLASAPGATLRGSYAPAARRAWMVVFPVAVFGAVWMLTAHLSAWIGQHGSEVDAWLILKTGWTSGQYVERALAHVIAFVRWGVGLSLACALFSALLLRGLPGARSASWLKAACHWRVLLTFAAALVVGVVLPSHLIAWRWLPAGKAGTWFEPAFVAVKLGLVYLWGNLVWVIVLRVVARRVTAAGAP